MDRFSSYIHGEGRTGGGQLLNYTCPREEKDRVRDFLLQNVREIEIPTTRMVNVAHGGYGMYSRYNMTQHNYAGGGPGEEGGWAYVEVLEIHQSPDGRHGVVVHECTSINGHTFTEFQTLKNAINAFEKFWSSGTEKTKQEFPKLRGFMRRAHCGPAPPWFYAIGDECLIGDCAFPKGLQDDTVFRIGKKFVVTQNDVTSIKTCLGTRFLKHVNRSSAWHSSNAGKESHYRLVYWDDGTSWNELHSGSVTPRELKAEEEWITEAYKKFLEMLSGKSNSFEIDFLNGAKFVGRIVEPRSTRSSPEGRYLLSVQTEGEEKPREGWTDDFTPTLEMPTIQEYVTTRLADVGRKVTRIDITDSDLKKKGRKWKGVFFKR